VDPDKLHIYEILARQHEPMLQQVCQLHYFEDQRTRDIAELLQLGLNAVLKRLERARDAIRDCIQKRLKMDEA
jgi:DNA-directed RNA polymerase specialized sigma24 family protein